MALSSTRLELLEDYSKTKNPETREKIIVEYLYLVKYIAGRMNIYSNPDFDYDDIVSFGIFGLIDAIEKFDIDKGVKFETYATLRIRGAIIDNIRKLDWVPRSLRQKSKELESLYSEMEIEIGRPPSDKEIADRMNISITEYNKFISEVNIQSLISLEGYFERNFQLDDGIVNIGSDESPENLLEGFELKNTLGEFINFLPEREKTVITLYYYEELTLKEIGTILKVSESRVSQLHTKAILRLRGKLSKYLVG